MSYEGTAAENLSEALDNGDTVAAEHWANVSQLELVVWRAEQRESYIRIHGTAPMINYCTTEPDGPTWEVSEAEAIKSYGYKLPGDEAAYYQNRIKADLDKTS